MKKLIPLLPFLFFLIASCDDFPTNSRPSTGAIRIVIGSAADSAESPPDSTSAEKAAVGNAIDVLEVRVLSSANEQVATKTLYPSGGWFEGSLTVKAQNNLKVLCIGKDGELVVRLGVDEDVDVKAGGTTEADIKGWNIDFIPAITGIDPNPSSDGSYTVTWNTSPNATGYLLAEADNARFEGAVTTYPSDTPQVGITGKPTGTYYYRVQAQYRGSVKSGWSESVSAVVGKTYTLSGTITGADGVTVTLSGPSAVVGDSNTQVVNRGGTYSFTVAEGSTCTVTPSKEGFKFLPASKTFETVSTNQSQDFIASRIMYTLSGTVTGANLVTVTLSGDMSDSQIVNEGGSYEFTVAEGGSYTVTPTRANFTFDPPNVNYTNLNAKQTQNFVGERIAETGFTLTIEVNNSDWGTVTPTSGTTYASGDEVTITATPASGYKFVGWEGTVNDSTSPTTTVTMTASTTIVANFEKIVDTFNIYGTITGADGVTVALSGDATGSQVVNSGGNYSFTVEGNGIYTVIPSKTGYTFNPSSKTFTNITSNQTQNFVASNVTYTVSGIITGANEVTVTLSGDGTGSQLVNSGDIWIYSFTVAGGGTYYITPSKTGYTFVPSNRSIVGIKADITQNFTAVPTTYTITGTITGADGVTVTLSGDASGSQVVNSGGNYSFTVNAGGNYTVKPTKTGYKFTPLSERTISGISSNMVQNFTASPVTYTISGIITGADSTLYMGPDYLVVTLSGDDNDTKIVGPPGNYSFKVAAGGNYTITPSKPGYTFTPSSKTFTNVTANQTQNFVASVIQSDGKIAFVSDRNGNRQIYVMNIDGSNQINLSNNQYHDNVPSWSPDGTKIAFASQRDGNWNIYVMNADGSNQIRLTDYSGEDNVPSWSPDGSKISFISTRDGGDDIYIMNQDGTNQTRLTVSSYNYCCSSSWSPDGSKMVFFSRRDGNYEIYIMNNDGSNQTKLTNNPFDDTYPSWSPNGMQIAFQSNRDGNYEIYLMLVNGTNQINLTNNASNDDFVCWSPDGNQISFSSERDGNKEIYIMNSDGSNLTKITNNTFNDWNPSWSPF